MIKYWIVWAIAVMIAYSAGCLLGSEHAKASCVPCNQKMYDFLYYSIVQDALRSQEVNAMTLRNTRIRALRDLCKGQRSTYETPLKLRK